MTTLTILLTTPDEAREAARRILGEDRFQPEAPRRAPQPFKQPLTWLGEQLRKLFEPLGDFLSRTVGRGGPIGWLLFAALVIGAVALIARAISRRVASRRESTTSEVRLSKRIAELEREAAAAAAAGRWAEAIRLRFRAGLLRIEDRGRVLGVEQRPNADVVRRATIDPLSPLADMHDRITYGEHPAAAADDAASKAGWDDVQGELQRSGGKQR
jgi:hypothetical protein